MINQVLQGDCLELMKDIPDGSVDAIITDPPYGYSFMGKDWDKAVPSVEIWQECLRVLKPGAFACVMSAPRSDVQNAMISRLMEAGFRLDFTPIYWTYASGFPKAGNVGKLVDKRLGAEREVVGIHQAPAGRSNALTQERTDAAAGLYSGSTKYPDGVPITQPKSAAAKALDGSYTGFQPKPAVEVIIVAMKPLSEKTYVDQALKNGKGITWLDDCRVPTGEKLSGGSGRVGGFAGMEDEGSKGLSDFRVKGDERGRFPANLLVSDEALNGHSKYFDLDAWAETLPFLAVPKASKSEKNKGLDALEARQSGSFDGNVDLTKARKIGANPDRPNQPTKNHHPTVKPLKLMSYLITLFSREGDTVLDPFVGSGTTGVACQNLSRNFILMEQEPEYVEIIKKRLAENEK